MIQFDNAVLRYRKIILDEMKQADITCWVAGGAVRDYFMGKPIKTDHDLFFPNDTEYEKATRFFKERNAEIKWESENGMKVRLDGRIFDLVKHFFAGPQETIDNFDFTVSMLAVDTERVYHGESTFIDLAKRQLMLNKVTWPASTLSRAFRYYKKGFSMCLGEMQKLTEAIQEMPKPKPEPEKENKSNANEDDEKPPSGPYPFFLGLD
jgi:hypothetical protein